tara:strand:+ start:785 stop:1318 length:534 start_codon:yes stop_codon:yes gene_type:complete
MDEEEEEEKSRKLLQAAWRGDVAECAALIAEGVAPSACVHGTTPLHESARRGQHAVTLLLLEHHANTQLRNYDGLTPLELHKKRYNWFRQTLVHLTCASHDAYAALYQRTGDERVTAVEATRASWRANNPQTVAAFDAAREALEAKMERGEITEGGFVERMNALRDAYVRCSTLESN